MSILALTANFNQFRNIFGFIDFGAFEVEDIGQTWKKDGETYNIYVLHPPLNRQKFEKKITEAGYKFLWTDEPEKYSSSPTIHLIASAVSFALRNTREIPPELSGLEPRHTGGYLTVILKHISETILIGTVADPERAAKYEAFSKEKADRLLNKKDDVSSWQSRDEDLFRYGGAIRTQDGVILSFSGLPELWDEALMIYAANSILDMDHLEEIGITEISKNGFADMLFSWLH